ncbi:hypothetical protein [Actinokineospora enzanensis]|uniref:hypothetical protein n=1 Tax=Actinokineospora enzanensis TaxID=155975 RepID=UPI000379F450|nr:hypothetical protein [Actinokineospora enzanensis]
MTIMSNDRTADPTIDATIHPLSAPVGTDDHPELDELDERIIALVLHRAHRARHHHQARRAAGLPAVRHSAEYDMVRRYSARLGPQGARIAAALLALARPTEPG